MLIVGVLLIVILFIVILRIAYYEQYQPFMDYVCSNIVSFNIDDTNQQSNLLIH